MSPRLRRILGRLLLVVIAAAIPLALGEVILRVLDPGHYSEFDEREAFSERLLERRLCKVDLGANGTRERLMLRVRPGVDTVFLGKRVVTDTRGMRTPPFAVPKPKDVYRILVLGDSLPFGWGVEEAETFPRLLERALAEGGGRRFEVVNGGSPGWGLDDEWQWLQEEGLALEPDLVLHCVIENDVREGPPPRVVLPQVLRYVRVLRFLENFWIKVTQPKVLEKHTLVTDEQLCLALDLLWNTCAQRQVHYVYLDTIGNARAAEHCKAKGYPRLDVFLSQDWVNRHQVAATDPHPNAEGHRYIAEQVFGLLRPMLPK